jgi:hypothetical protein
MLLRASVLFTAASMALSTVFTVGCTSLTKPDEIMIYAEPLQLQVKPAPSPAPGPVPAGARAQPQPHQQAQQQAGCGN